MRLIERYDYTYRIENEKGKGLVFRDITGNDLEFLAYLLEQKQGMSIDEYAQLVMENFCIFPCKSSFPNLSINLVRNAVTVYSTEVIALHFIDKLKWMELVYLLCDRSFAALKDMGDIPMEQFLAMIQIAKDNQPKLER